MTTLTIQNESMTGRTLSTVTIEVASQDITLFELIRSHVYQQTKDANVKQASQPRPSSIVQPTEDEALLNGSKDLKVKTMDWETEFKKAIQAFDSNQIMVFVNDRQMNSLDEVISVDTNTIVKFLRLTMLMGG